MSVATATKARYTVSEYLELEGRSAEKHEFFDGEIFAMAGASYEHNVLVANLTRLLGNAVGERCQVLAADQRLYIPATGLYTYADASLLCERPDLTNETPPSLKNPDALFEVLSPSTESYDRGKKFENYRTIPSLMHYVLVAQDQVLVEHFVRQPGGRWLLEEVRAGQSLSLPCGSMPIDPLYRRVLP